jgi:DNA-binding transcriptional MerR regulator
VTLPNGLLDIAEVGRQSGLAPSALRFYERRGLLTPSGRHGQRRVYSPDVLDRLALIACARQAGFTIAEIARFLVAAPGDEILRAHLARKAHELDDDIRRLQGMRDSLAHAATCTHTPLVECPDFKQSVARSR